MQRHVVINTLRIAKRTLIFLLVFTLISGSLPFTAIAEEATEVASESAGVEPTPVEEITGVDPTIEAIINEETPEIRLETTITPQVQQESAKIKELITLRKLRKKNYAADEKVHAIVDNAGSENIDVVIKDSRGKKKSFSIREIVEGETRIFTLQPPSALEPGRYTVTLTDGQTTLTQDFTWGVLAINTNKASYLPKEKAAIALAVLDEKGEMACDASVLLTITNPEGGKTELSTEGETIAVTDSCRVKDITERADFETSYVTDEIGTYAMELTAVQKDESYTITDTFEVVESVPFVVERKAATRIYPLKPYKVTMEVTANQDFQGTVTEMVPEHFEVTQHAADNASIQSVQSVATVDSREEVAATLIDKLGMPFEGDRKMTLGFGEQLTDPALKKTYEEFGLSGHDGIDYDMPTGTPILAVDDGTVTLAKDSDYGLTVVIQHAWGKSYYGHVSKITTKLNKRVTKGERIALSGSTGLSSGAHLHFGIKLNEFDSQNGYFGKTNPLPFLPEDTEDQGEYGVKFLTWNVTLKKGEKTTLSYTYDAPDQSPQFYTVGPLTFEQSEGDTIKTVFKESRVWHIAVDATTHMLLFWDPANGAAPSGWSVVTTYDGRFIRGESVANVLTTGGNATHTPTVSGSVTLSVPSSGRAAAGANTISSYGHTHGTPSVTIGSDDNLPSFRSMQLIQYDSGIPSTIPANAIALFDASPGMPGSGWTRVAAQDTRMLRANSSVATGGSDTHTHTLTWGALTAASGQITTGSNTNNQGATTNHTHTAPTATNSDSQTSLPPYVHAVVASANSTVAIPTGMIAMFDGQPSNSYSIQSDSGGAFYQRFVRGNTVGNVGTTGGSATHSHGASSSGPSGAASANARGTATAGTTAAGNGHTHTLSANFTASDDHTPEYVNLVFGEKVDVADLTQIHSRWRNDDGSETTATWRRSEDVAATGDNGTNRRLRIEVSNEGTLTSGSTTYRLEYGQKSTTCDAIVTWTAVPATATTEDFEMFNSSNLTDGNATTNVAGGLTDENTSFVAGQVKDTGNQTTGITLTATEFTELEYSIAVTANPTAGEEFCFRVTNAGSTTSFTYAVYPEITVGDPVIEQTHYRWRNDDSTETTTTGNTLYYNPTGNGFAQGFTIAAGCTGGNEWVCVDDGSSDTSATAPTNDGATSALTSANGTSYFTLANDGVMSGSTITRLDVFAYAIDTGNPNTNIQLGYCTTCDGANNTLGGAQAVNVGSYTQYTSAFTGLSLSTTDLNNMQLVVSADGTRANISTVYVLVTYTRPGATWKQSEDTAHTGQAKNENIRLRLAVANTGDIPANRNFRLEYAVKVGASCGDDESFTTLPVTATSEHFEMTTSSNFTDGEATTTQLTATGSFSAGEMVEDPSNSTGTYAVANGTYTEYEFNFQANTNASGTYCFRITDNGTVLDQYDVYPELSIGSSATLDQKMRFGKYFSGGRVQPFTF